MSLASILQSSSSGLYAAQTQLGVISDNIANINTPGYARRTADQSALYFAGLSGGVQIDGISRVVDSFLQQASVSASSDAGAAAALSNMLDQAQTLFGDPTGTSSFFGQLDKTFAAFSAAGTDATSSVSRSAAVTSLINFLNQASGVSNGVSSLQSQSDSQIGSDVTTINGLLSQVDSLNASITQAKAAGADTTNAQNAQAQLVDQLSGLIDVQAQQGPDGRLTLRGPGGNLLVGPSGPATLAYSTTGSAPGQLTAAIGGASPVVLTPTTGEISGLLSLRNSELPGLGAQLGQYVSGAVEQINAAHNAYSAVPAPASLTGRDTGLDLPTALSGFTGKTTFAIVDSSGVIQKQVQVDFDAGTMTTDGGSPVSFDSTSFLSTLNGQLGSDGTASFANGALSLSAASGSGDGVAIADDATTPSNKIGEGFSQFFGMNDLITSTGYPKDTGLQPTDASGFTGQISLRLSNASGAPLRDVTVNLPSGGSMSDMLSALNSTSGGVGLYGSFSLDSKGALSFSPNANGASLSVVSDSSQRGAGGPSMSQLFSLDSTTQANAGSTYSVRADIASDPSQLAFAKLDLSAAAGTPALQPGDNAGALALANVATATSTFPGASGPMTIDQFGAQLSGLIGQKANGADTALTNAQAVASEASSRRSSVEGVNLDQELANLTTYQQAYSASARVVSAVKDMYDTLLGMMT